MRALANPAQTPATDQAVEATQAAQLKSETPLRAGAMLHGGRAAGAPPSKPALGGAMGGASARRIGQGVGREPSTDALRLQRLVGNLSTRRLLVGHASEPPRGSQAAGFVPGIFGGRVGGETALASELPAADMRPPGSATPKVHAPAALPACVVQRDEEDGGWDILGSIRSRIESLVDGLRSGWDTVSSLATEAFAGLNSTLESATGGLVEAAGGVVGQVQAAQMQATAFLTQLVGGMRDTLGSWVAGIAGAGSAIRLALRAMDAEGIGKAWAALQTLLAGAWSFAQSFQASLAERADALWEQLQFTFESAWSGVQSTFTALWDRLAEQVDAVRERVGDAWRALADRAGALGSIVEELPEMLRGAVDRLMAWAEEIWDGISAQWDELVGEIGTLLSSMRERVTGVWDTLSGWASSAWTVVEESWNSLTEAVREEAAGLAGAVGDLWDRIAGTSIQGVVERVGRYSTFVRSTQQAVDHPDRMLDEVAAPVVGQLQARMPAAAYEAGRERLDEAAAQAGADRHGGAATTPVLRSPDASVQRQAERSVTSPGALWEGLTEALSEKWGQLDVWQLVKHVLITLIWPWPTVRQELAALWEDWTHTADDLFLMRSPMDDLLGALHDLWSNFLALLDFPHALWRRINNVVMALMGWITIALTVLGAIGGTVAGTVIGAIAGAVSSLGIATAPGAAGGAGAGGLAGAGAGFGVALALGELFVISFAAAETVSVVKMLVDLLTARQTESQKSRDFNQAADSIIALGILAVLLALAWFAGRIASAVAPFLKKIPLPRRLVQGAREFAEGVRSTRPRPTERGPVGEELVDGERVVRSERTADGHQVKVTESGRIFICTTCQELRIRYAEELMRDTPEMERLRAELDEVERMPNGDEKLQAAERIKAELDRARAEARGAEPLATKVAALERQLVDSRGAIESAKETFRGENLRELRADPEVRRALARQEAEVDAAGREWQQLREQVETARTQAEDPVVKGDPELSELAGRDIDALRERLDDLRTDAERIRQDVEERVRQHEEARARQDEITRQAEERAEEAADRAENTCNENDGTNRPDASIGDGSTEAAIREEIRTGRPHRSAEGHHIKARESITALRRAIDDMQQARPDVRNPDLLRRMDEVTARSQERISRLNEALSEWNQRAATHPEVFAPDGSSRVTPDWP